MKLFIKCNIASYLIMCSLIRVVQLTSSMTESPHFRAQLWLWICALLSSCVCSLSVFICRPAVLRRCAVHFRYDCWLLILKMHKSIFKQDKCNASKFGLPSCPSNTNHFSAHACIHAVISASVTPCLTASCTFIQITVTFAFSLMFNVSEVLFTQTLLDLS